MKKQRLKGIKEGIIYGVFLGIIGTISGQRIHDYVNRGVLSRHWGHSGDFDGINFGEKV